MLRRSFIAAALLGALVAAAPAGAPPAEQAALNAASFKDAAGDSGAAPDITDVDVGNDVVAGPIVMWITVPNRPDDLVDDDVLWVGLDIDQNAATGDELGVEYWIGVAETVWLERWDGTDYVNADATSLRANFVKSAKAIRISIHPDRIGVTSAFDFFVEAVNGEEADAAPNGSPAWRYTLASGRPLLSVLGFVLKPKAAGAGKPLTATMAVARADTRELLTLGKVTCTLIVGGKPVKAARAAFVDGLPQCRWSLPRSAKGKLLKGTISVTYGGSTAKKSFSARVK
jgi:hypothetical protein